MKANIHQLSLMAVLAHPDDETFGMGGTLAVYAQKGVRVHLVCATRGEVGEADANLLQGFSSVGALREHELRCAAKKIGLASVNFLGYRDSGMRGSPENQHPDALINAPIDLVVKKIDHYFLKYQPQVIITFDPLGGYMHPDHIAIQRATEKAFFKFHGNGKKISSDGYSPSKLYFHTFPHKTLKIILKILPFFGLNPTQFGRNKDINLLDMVQQDFPITTRINYKNVMEIREQAFACHTSQGGGKKDNLIVTWLGRLSSKQDTFMRAFPPYDSKRVEKDLFDGI